MGAQGSSSTFRPRAAGLRRPSCSQSPEQACPAPSGRTPDPAARGRGLALRAGGGAGPGLSGPVEDPAGRWELPEPRPPRGATPHWPRLPGCGQPIRAAFTGGWAEPAQLLRGSGMVTSPRGGGGARGGPTAPPAARARGQGGREAARGTRDPGAERGEREVR